MTQKSPTNSQNVFLKAQEKGMVSERSNYLKFKNTGEHIVRFTDDRAITGTNFGTGKEEEKMRYSFLENDIKKTYETAMFKMVENEDGVEEKKLSSFVENMQDYEYGDTIKMEYTKIKGTPRGYVKMDKMNMDDGEEEELEGEKPEPKKVVPQTGASDEDAEEFFNGKVPGTDDEEIKASDVPF